jgi:hypothetical protein
MDIDAWQVTKAMPIPVGCAHPTAPTLTPNQTGPYDSHSWRGTTGAAVNTEYPKEYHLQCHT